VAVAVMLLMRREWSGRLELRRVEVEGVVEAGVGMRHKRARSLRRGLSRGGFFRGSFST